MNTCQSEMKVPIRPAPPPPVNAKFPAKIAPSWNGPVKDTWSKAEALPQKKKPPPRPPPPKFNNKKSAPSRPSQLIADLFRKNHVNSKAPDVQITKPGADPSDSKGNNVLMLIDFSSPPSSPTLTTRSSSDALSVNSFGSDGVTQCSGSSGNTSNVESGFEDDFDLFPSTSKQPRDPWSPPPAKPSEAKNPFNGKPNSWVTFPSPGVTKKIPQGVCAMPTIIRSKPERPRVPQKPINCDNKSSVDLLSDIFQSANLENPKIPTGDSIFEEDDDSWSSESPPMPTCPPPAPPPEILNDLLTNVDNLEAKPSGIALYDYAGEQPEDLSFKKDDVIFLVRRIDDNWFVGEKDGREGTVPANFLWVQVPLPGDDFGDRIVTALYAFRPETWDDLEFEEGSTIKVTHRIDQDWLFGECNGKSGQFPANFVDRVPNDLPPRRTG